MRLKKHREDVKDLKLMQSAHVQDIAKRYQRLIRMAEIYLGAFDKAELWPHEKRVLKDAGVK
jgi:hypothetical protein